MNLAITNDTVHFIVFRNNNIDYRVDYLYYGTDLVWPQGPQHDYSTDYFTVETLEANNYITLHIPAELTPQDLVSVSYSTDDGATWTTVSIDNTAKNVVVILQNVGDKAIFKGTGRKYSTYLNSVLSGSSFVFTKNGNIYGNIMSLLYGDNFVSQTTFDSSNEWVFAQLFKDNAHLVDASNLVLPATTLAPECYQAMFQGCTSLVTSPIVLPATTLADYCYYYMFTSCTSLTTAPSLPATTLTPSCYGSMFRNCTSLTTLPELPATTLASWCYASMFRNCTSLTTSPELPATTLAIRCYYEMFSGCTLLNKVTCLATDISATNCLLDWVKNVSSTGTFYKDPSMSSWPSGASGIPSGWTIQNYSA